MIGGCGQMGKRKKTRMACMAAVLALTVGVLSGCGGGAAGTGQEGAASGQDNVQAKEAAASGQENAVVETSTAGHKEGDQAPGLRSFSAGTLDGGTFTQEDIAERDVTVINFWGTYCGPCLEEMPDIAQFSKTLPENVQVVTMCVDGAYAPEQVQDILDEAGYEGVTLLTCDGDLERLLNEFQFIPTTIFVGRDGTIVGDMIVGGQSDLSQAFLNGINNALQSQGKAAIGDEEK